ncbi:MAG: LysE family translocator [Reyranella sp.]|uniref:LysE family translocator n=1 Tax=Reyranella sp. TaxID=1929291 RepID=UPI001AD3CB96|nr:LysE family translocator [Reyranella sp.]MBN9091602.1 LysE family translocator [Reyranella sp.]
MTLQTYWLYLGAVLLISATPGPNIFYVTSRSIRFGFGAAMLAMTGCLLALLIILSASVAGVSAFMLAVPAAFEAMKYAGAAYLIWLGVQTWRAPAADVGVNDSPRETASRFAHFRGGFLVGISNPKLLVFAAAFFPQFITKSAPWIPQFGLLVATFLMVEACAYVTVASSARGLSRYLVQAVWQRRLNRLSGAIFAGFGVALLRYRP